MKRLEELDAPMDKVWKLTKSLYGLKQASKLLHEKFNRLFVAMGIESMNLTNDYTSRLRKER